ncbi:MAG: RluA family pseudouridine synthase [Defluviitaleaceae bacterium]|nr:RluA family pseudouridine synthase [Defluviitaleaceae bacterium]
MRNVHDGAGDFVAPDETEFELFRCVVPPEAHGLRADIFLAQTENFSRSAAQKLFEDEKIFVSREKNFFEKINKNYRVATGEIIFCEIPAPVASDAAPENIPLNIVYEDADLLVVDKPRGLVVHPAAGNQRGTLVNALLFHCELSGIGGVLRPGIVHRLDKDTSGLLVVAKNDAAHLNLSAQLERREMTRIYSAICVGVPAKEKLKIDLPIGRHPRDRKKMAVLTTHGARARNAVTYVEIIARLKNAAHISARLETGRTHQIRVHMAHVGHPILGDCVYGSPRQNFGGQILHAQKIKFVHPKKNSEMEFISPLPEYFRNVLEERKF